MKSMAIVRFLDMADMPFMADRKSSMSITPTATATALKQIRLAF